MIILEVKMIKISKNKNIEFEDYAWTIFPLFTYNGYVNSGVY